MNLLTSNVWAIEPFAFDRYLRMAAKLSTLDLSRIDESVAAAMEEGSQPRIQGGVARIPVRGPLVKSVGFIEAILGFTSTADIQAMVEAAAADESVKQIVLEVDSPGGSVSGIAELADAVFTARDDKPVIAQVDGMAASAGYMIASQATEIYAGREDMTGSIGVRLMLYDFSKLFEEVGIEAVPIDTGEFKSAGAMGTEITERQREDFQRIVDTYFDGFVDAIMRGRDMAEAGVREVADGRIFVGQESVDLGLVDGIQTMRETLSNLASSNRQTSRRAAARVRVA